MYLLSPPPRNAHHWLVRLATLGPVGYLPAPGTWASLLTCGMAALLMARGYLTFPLAYTLIGMTIGSAIIAGALRVLKLPHKADPRYVVLDEVVGYCVALSALPLTPINLLLAFCLFRFFDITKPGFHRVERSGGWFAIMVDDVIAGLITNTFMRLFITFTPLARWGEYLTC